MDFQAKNVALPFGVLAPGAVINASVVNKLSIAPFGKEFLRILWESGYR